MTSGWRAYTTRIGNAFRALRERGQSETLGVALLTGIVLILVALVGLFLFADFGADDEEQLLANIEGDVEATNITLSHEGGDTFKPQNVEVVLTGDAEREFVLGDDFSAIEGGGGEFAPGDIWGSGALSDFVLGEGRLLVIHEPTSTILLDQPYDIGNDGIDLAVETYPEGTMRGDSATIHGDAGWNYNLDITLGGSSYDESEISHNITFLNDDTDLLTAYTSNSTIVAQEPSGGPENAQVEANVTDDGEVVDTSVVNLTIVESPEFTVDLTVGNAGNVLGGNSLGTSQVGPTAEIVEGETLAVEAEITNKGGAVDTQEISFDSGGLGTPESTKEKLQPGDSKTLTFTRDTSTGDAGSYTIEVATEDETATETVDVLEPASFDVTIDDTNSPVPRGGTATIDATITNTGEVTGEQTISITSSPTPLGNTTGDVTREIGAGNSITETFNLNATGITTGTKTVTVESANDSDDASVLIAKIAVSSVTVNTSNVWHGGDFSVDTVVTTPGLDDESVTMTVEITSSAISGPTDKQVTVGEGTESVTETFDLTADNKMGIEDTEVSATAKLGSVTSASRTAKINVGGVNLAITGASPESDPIASAGENLKINYNLVNDVDYALGTLDVIAELFVNGDLKSNDGSIPVSTTDIPKTLTAGSDDFTANPGGNISWTVEAADKGPEYQNTQDSASGTVAIESIDSGDLAFEISDANEPVEGDDIEVTTSVEALSSILSTTSDGGLSTTSDVGTQSLLSDTIELVTPMGTQEKSITIDLGDIGSPIKKTFTVSTSMGDRGEHTVTASLLNMGMSDQKTMQVHPMLELQSVSVPNQVNIADNLNVDYTIKNNGSKDVTETVRLVVDGTYEEKPVTVSSGATTSGTLTFSSVSNNYGIGDTIDVTVDIVDSDTNPFDSTTGQTDVTGDPANFQVAIQGSPSTSAGSDLDVDVDVSNAGDLSATQDVTLDVGTSVGTQTKSVSLDGGETKTKTFSISTTADDAGTHVAVAETADGTDTANVDINGPNLQLTSVNGPAEVATSGSLDVTYTIENTGTEPGTESFVDLKVSGTGNSFDDTHSDVTVSDGGTVTDTLTFDNVDGEFNGGDTISWSVALFDNGDSMSGTTSVLGAASFGVTITGTNSPITEGDTLEVTAQITNTGGTQGTQGIDLDVGSLGTASTAVTLDSGDSTQKTLSINTNSGDAGDYTATVSSDDTSESQGVKVNGAAAPSNFQVTIDSIAGQSFNPVVEVPAGGTTIDVDYTVENTGGKGGSTSVQVSRNGNNAGSTTETVPPEQTRSGTFSVSIGDSHISGNGISIEVTTDDDSASETVETKALRIVSHSVDDTVHPFLYENMTTVVENIGSTTASDTLIITNTFDSGGYESTQSITVDPDDPEWQRTFHVGLDQATAEAMFGKSDWVDAELDTYEDTSTGPNANFDIHGDVWLKQDYVDDLSMDDSSTNPGLLDCAFSLPPNILGCLDVDFTLQPGSSSDVVVPDGMSKSNINGGFRIYGEGSFLGDFPGSITDSTIVLEESLGQNINYQNRVTESNIITDSDQSYYQLSHILTSGNDVLEYEFPDVVFYPSNVYCGITGDFGSNNYETTKDKPFSNWASNNDWTDVQLTQYDESNNYQCDDLNSGGGFFGP